MLRESGKEVVEGDMPPWYYRALHPDAAPSSADKQLLEAWTRGAQERRQAPQSTG